MEMHEFIFELPLYKPVYGEDKVLSIAEFTGEVDGYSPVKKSETTYEVTSDFELEDINRDHSRFIRFNLTCKRTGLLCVIFAYFKFVRRYGLYDSEGNEADDLFKLEKVGQYPAIKDMQNPDDEEEDDEWDPDFEDAD